MTDKIKETEVLRKHIIGENGISYTLGEDGLYYPDLRLPEGTQIRKNESRVSERVP